MYKTNVYRSMRDKQGQVKVSAIIPCRNEDRYIKTCLDSLAAQTYPREKMEILVVDGMSGDNTRQIVRAYEEGHSYVKMLDNPRRIIPVAMNIGIKNAKGDVVMKMDAHASYPKEYVSKCVRALRQYGADNVGGILITKPGRDTLQAHAIALCLSHWFGVGSSPFRRESNLKNPREVDTVAFGCYKREVFDKIGLYNENLVRSSDMELNIRLKNAGGKILLVPNITAYYYADPTLAAFWNHNVRDGIWATYPLKFTPHLLRPRHLIPFVFVSFLLLLLFLSLFFRSLFYLLFIFLAAYLIILLIASSFIATREKDMRYLLIMPIAFAVRHFGYGIGSLIGVGKLLFNK